MTDTGGPAFPTQELPQPQLQDGTWAQNWFPLDEGMTLLDKFADSALRGAISNQKLMDNVDALVETGGSPTGFEVVSRLSYNYAQAMIAEKRRLEKEDG